MSLIPSIEENQNNLAQEIVDNFTFGFFSDLKTLWSESTTLTEQMELDFLLKTKFFTSLDGCSKIDTHIYRELEEKVYTLLSWLVQYLWSEATPNSRRLSHFLPVMVNQFIQSPKLNLHGRPSAVFVAPNKSALILIQTYRSEHKSIRNLSTLQASIYAQILESMEIKAKNFLYVNYHAMTLFFKNFKPIYFKNLEKLLFRFQIAIEEKNFDPTKAHPCVSCEFNLICNYQE